MTGRRDLHRIRIEAAAVGTVRAVRVGRQAVLVGEGTLRP